MKYYILIIIVLFSCNVDGYSQQGQNVLIIDSTGVAKVITIYKDTVINEWSFHKVAGRYDSIFLATPVIDTLGYYQTKDTAYLNPKYKIQSVIDDSIHYWFTRYIKLKNKHVPDSLNKYYFKLIKK